MAETEGVEEQSPGPAAGGAPLRELTLLFLKLGAIAPGGGGRCRRNMVVRLGSVSGAARQLNVSQPAVSAHLRALEGRLGAKLFERTPRGVLLKEEGRVVLERADRLFDMQAGIAAAVDGTG